MDGVELTLVSSGIVTKLTVGQQETTCSQEGLQRRPLSFLESVILKRKTWQLSQFLMNVVNSVEQLEEKSSLRDISIRRDSPEGSLSGTYTMQDNTTVSFSLREL